MSETHRVVASKIEGENVIAILIGERGAKDTIRLTPEQAINFGADLMEHATNIIRKRTHLRTKQQDTV